MIFITVIKSYAHKDRIFTYEFDNVTVKFKTGFKYEEINNARIIGEYASLLCEKMNYDQPVLLDFIHDYGNSYKGKNYSYLTIGTDKYKIVSYYTSVYDSTINENVYQMVPHSSINEQSLNGIEKEVYNTNPIDSLEKIVIRQLGFHFVVKNTLNFLYYAISNSSEVITSSQNDTLCSYLSNMYYEFNSIPKTKIDSIKTLEINDVENVMRQKIYAKEDSVIKNQLSYSYFAKNNSYSIIARYQNDEIILDTLNQVYSFELNNEYWQTVFVFETLNSFKCYEKVGLENEFKKSKLHEIPIERNEGIVFSNVNWISDDIYFINRNNIFETSPFKIFPYLMKEDILIFDFENYINIHRRNNK
jgi:hypothetical protein